MNNYLTRPATPKAIRIEGGKYSFVNEDDTSAKPSPIREETASTLKPTKREIPAVK